MCGGHSELSLHSDASPTSLSETIETCVIYAVISTRVGPDLLFKHCTLELPVYPMGQGSTLHASLQVPSTHSLGSRQSRSTLQDGVGVTRL